MIDTRDMTDCQKEALRMASQWYRSKSKLFFVIDGWAGTGKSSLIPHIADSIGLRRHNIRVCTFTGKASLVLIRKGIESQTIHSLIMYPVTSANGTTTFVKKHRLEPEIKLIIIDERSMVSNSMMKDLLSFKVPMILLGDPGQLPPVGEQNRYITKPDIVLDKIHRQAEGNEIIVAATKIRMGEDLPLSEGNDVKVRDMSMFTQERAFWADQVLVGYNRTRKIINANMRNDLGRVNMYPVEGDKIICLKNNQHAAIAGYMLVNGMTGFIEKLDQFNSRLDFRPEFLEHAKFRMLKYDPGIFLGRDYDPQKLRMHTNPFDYGYAITVHKAQGSQYRNTVVIEEVLRQETHRQWLYTAATRAEEKLEIYKTTR